MTGKCEDIDECSDVHLNNCDQHCENNLGSYSCTCQNGFVFENGNCRDVDECAGKSECDQDCENTIGSYRCICGEGYSLNLLDRQSCILESICENDNGCIKKNADCVSVNFTSTCVCRKGYASNKDGVCEDIKECSRIPSPCQQDCEEEDGGFSCSCKSGFKIVAGVFCEACDDRHFGKNCQEICQCNAENTVTCDNVNGSCDCKMGWTDEFCKTDEDECKVNESICFSKNNSVCTNTVGSYRCDCKEGYNELDKTCQDKNECLDGSANCIQDCINTDGSFMCRCFTGFSGNGINCTECKNNTFGDNCEERCNCTEENTENLSQICDTKNGRCNCKSGWDGTMCQNDINECVDVNICKHFFNTGCNNLKGSFNCDCLRGFSNISGTCEKVDDPPLVVEENMMVHNFTVTLSFSLPEGANLKTASVYKEVKQKVIEGLMDFYVRNGVFQVNVFVYSMSVGSLIVDYGIVYDPLPEIQSHLALATSKLSSGDGVVQFGDFNVSAKLNVNQSVCELFTKFGGNCEIGYSCESNGQLPVCKLEPTYDSFVLIMGISVGSGMLVIGVLAYTFCLWTLRKEREQRKHQKKSGNDRLHRQEQGSSVRSKVSDSSPKFTTHPKWNNWNNWWTQRENTNENRYETWKSMVIHATKHRQILIPRLELSNLRSAKSRAKTSVPEIKWFNRDNDLTKAFEY